jgi:radical SAM superfamily enzyme YgiQ (UPF0313 family)
MKILLIQCDSVLGKVEVQTTGKGSMPPLGLMYLSGYLKKHGFTDIFLLDLIMEPDRIGALNQFISKFGRDEDLLIGFYMNTRVRFAVREAIKIVKAHLPKAIICAGGPHPTLDKEDTLKNCDGLDFIVIGEGEETFLEVVKALTNDFKISAVKDIIGLSLRLDGHIIHNAKRDRIKDLNDLSFPDRDIVDIKKYRFTFSLRDKELQKTFRPTTIIASRGCPYQCVFCSVADQWGRLNTFSGTDRVIEEMKLLKEKYNFNALYFCDDTFTLNRKRTVELCAKMIEAELNMIWFCELRANTVDEELLTLMYKAGLRSAAMAVESASPRILKEVVKKGITLEQAQEAVKILKNLGVAIKVFFTYSYPTETKEDVKMTLDFIRKLDPDLPAIARLLVYPGTPLHKYAQEHNLLPKGFSWFKYYSFYDSLSNPTFAPTFVDKLTTSDFIWVRNELAEISGSPTLADRSIFELIRNFIKSIRKVRSAEDFSLFKSRFAIRFKQLFK